MTIGIDIGLKNISGALLLNNKVISVVDKSIYDQKRDCSRVIMVKILSLIQELFAPQVRGIGLSLPSKLDEKRGVIYDIAYIPYWKKVRLKSIIEETFNVPTILNTDINCHLIGEKNHGICKDFRDILCITVEPRANVSVVVNNRLHKDSFEKYDCLSKPSYNCVRNYRKSYIRTLEDLDFLAMNFNPEKMNNPECDEWNDLGGLLGRLITIILNNYEPQIVVLGGNLSKLYPRFAQSLDNYIERYVPPQVLLNLIIVGSLYDNPRPLGAASLAYKIQELVA